jgi:hypothetical protein
MGIKISILFLIFFSLNLYSTDEIYFGELKTKVNLQKDEQLVVLYQNIGNCTRCYILPMEQVSNLKNEGVIKKFKMLALVICDRDIELNIYKKQHNWKYYLFRDDGKGHKRLDTKASSYLSVFDYYGKKIYEME